MVFANPPVFVDLHVILVYVPNKKVEGENSWRAALTPRMMPCCLAESTNHMRFILRWFTA